MTTNNSVQSQNPMTAQLQLFQQMAQTFFNDVSKQFDSLERLTDRSAFAPRNNGQTFFKAVEKQFDFLGTLINRSPVAQPAPVDSSHPQGSLKAEGNKITTAGGYTIEVLGQHRWKITDPNGVDSTEVWGDPHVNESDRGAGGAHDIDWDFKRDSTWVLGDGTRINVTTKPWEGNPAMTITAGLEIISGNDRVVSTGIDSGNIKTTGVTQDGFQNVNNFAGKDVFVMGDNAADWTFGGKEILTSNNGGDSFNLGNEMRPGGNRRFVTEQMNMFMMMQMMQQMMRMMQDMLSRMQDFNRKPYLPSIMDNISTPSFGAPTHNFAHINQGVPAIQDMFSVMTQQTDLTVQFNQNRTATRA